MIEQPGESDRLLIDTPTVTVNEHRRVHDNPALTEERGDNRPSLTIVRQGAHLHHARGEVVVADAGSAVLYRADVPYRLSHPFLRPSPDVSLYLEFDRALLDEMFGPEAHARDIGHPLAPAIQAAAALLSASASEDPLVEEERALALLGDVSGALALDRDDPALGALARRRIAALREALAAAPEDHHDLAGLAMIAGCSPFHLTRLFRRVTGLTIGGFRLRLRLARVLQALADGADNLTTVALEAGFADHAHMTNSVRRVFGTTPSALRETLGGRGLSETSKTIQASAEPLP